MSNSIGRNDLCTCGSGKKYKKCCLVIENNNTQTEFKPQYRFEPGSYGDVGNFIPSIACLKSTQNGAWEYHFVLINPGQVAVDEDQAIKQSHDDLSVAFERKNKGGTNANLAAELKNKGYVSLKDFNIVNNGNFQA